MQKRRRGDALSLAYDPAASALAAVPDDLWSAGPMTDRKLQANETVTWLLPTSAFGPVGALLGWMPPAGANLTYPTMRTLSTVRLLGGWSPASPAENTTTTAWSDLVWRSSANGSLVYRWDALWDRLDLLVATARLQLVVVLDNVPYALALNGGAESVYGQVDPPANDTEYGLFIETVVRGIADRYGADEASGWLWRVGTEPNTRPGHWNGTDAQWVGMYVAAARAVRRVLPAARVGPGNFCAFAQTVGACRTTQPDVEAILDGIVAAGAPISFLATSTYGAYAKTILGYEPVLVAQDALALRDQEARHPVLAGLPRYAFEYGTLDNEAGALSGEPGAFGTAWRVVTGVLAGAQGIGLLMEWNPLDFSLAPSSAAAGSDAYVQSVILAGALWLRAVAHTIPAACATGPAVALGSTTRPAACPPEATLPGGRCIAPRLAADPGAVQVAGLGVLAGPQSAAPLPPLRVGALGPAPPGTLLLLAASFSANRTASNAAVNLTLSFPCPASWGTHACQQDGPSPPALALVLDSSTSVYDTLLAEAVANNTAKVAPHLVAAIHDMLTASGLDNAKASAHRWLAAQASLLSPVPASTADILLACSAGTCTATRLMATPASLALWIGPGLEEENA